MINGERVKQAREFRGITQKQLAEDVEVHPSEIAQIETGRITPGDEVLQRIAFRVGFPISFFTQPTSIDFPLGSLLYRARAAITKKECNEVYQYSRMFYEVISNLEKNIDNKSEYLLPRLEDTPENAAIKTRSVFSLSPDSPVANLTKILERHRILVMALPTKVQKIDAFSVWVGDQTKRPIIVLANSAAPGDRLRFNIAHELGHLVLHQTPRGNVGTLEKEAHRFASEFLMPREAMLKELVAPVTLSLLIHLKERWMVSIQALMLRALRLEIISNRQYKYLMYQINNRNWRRNEPVDIKIEKPRFVSQLFEMLYGKPIDYRLVAKHANLPIQLIKNTIEAHVISSNELKNGPNNDSNGNVITLARKKG